MILQNVNPQNVNKALKRAAFTLIELVVVIAIIVALAGMGGWAVMGMMDSSKEDTARTQATFLHGVVDAYYAKNGDLPPSLDALLQPGPNSPALLDNPQKLRNPFNQPYQLVPQGDSFYITSTGKGGKELREPGH